MGLIPSDERDWWEADFNHANILACPSFLLAKIHGGDKMLQRLPLSLIFNKFHTGHSVLRGGGFSKLSFRENQYMYLVHWVEEGLDPRGDFFDPAILTHFMAKNCPKSAINGTPSHKHAWRLQNGGSVRIKVGSRQDTSGGMCWDHFPGPKWPSGGAIGPQNGSKWP